MNVAPDKPRRHKDTKDPSVCFVQSVAAFVFLALRAELLAMPPRDYCLGALSILRMMSILGSLMR